MPKRVFRKLIICAMIICIIATSVYGTINSSAYIMSTSASATQGSSTGQIKVHYSITGTTTMTTLGASKIEVYKSNGTLYKTITGSFANGLLKQNGIVASGTYAISCVSGTSYYCRVTLYAGNNSGSDSRTITTVTVTAP